MGFRELSPTSKEKTRAQIVTTLEENPATTWPYKDQGMDSRQVRVTGAGCWYRKVLVRKTRAYTVRELVAALCVMSAIGIVAFVILLAWLVATTPHQG